MPNSAEKGKKYERELVRQCEAADVPAQRAYASNGKALGEHKNCDVKLSVPNGPELTVQAKRRANVGGYLTDENVDLVAVREDHGQSLAVVPLDLFLDLLQQTADDT
jgi:Holliday junction resolvase